MRSDKRQIESRDNWEKKPVTKRGKEQSSKWEQRAFQERSAYAANHSMHNKPLKPHSDAPKAPLRPSETVSPDVSATLTCCCCNSEKRICHAERSRDGKQRFISSVTRCVTLSW